MVNKIECIKKVREITGKGLYECKTTLEETNYDIERALMLLAHNGKIIEKSIFHKPIDDTSPKKNFKNKRECVHYKNKIIRRRFPMLLRVRKYERALLYRYGDFKKLLMPGKHFVSPFNGYSVEVYNVSEPFSPQRELNLYLGDEKLKEALTIVDVKDNEIALYFEEERLVNFLKPGRYAYWKWSAPLKLE